MAYFDTSYEKPSRLHNFIARIFETPFDARQRRLARKIADLRALSDAQLAARGLCRQDILAHVFKAGR